MYDYQYDAQGNVTALILGSDASVQVRYRYDAWGNATIIGTGTLLAPLPLVGTLNPYRYRGYRYDTETGLYYLQSRYYDPQTGRFINSDSVLATGSTTTQGLNLFVYCNNNPVMGVDPTGACDMSPGAQAAYDAWFAAYWAQQQAESQMSSGARAARDRYNAAPTHAVHHYSITTNGPDVGSMSLGVIYTMGFFACWGGCDFDPGLAEEADILEGEAVMEFAATTEISEMDAIESMSVWEVQPSTQNLSICKESHLDRYDLVPCVS